MTAAAIQASIEQFDANMRDAYADAPESALWESFGFLMAGYRQHGAGEAMAVILESHPEMARFAVQSTLRCFAQLLLSRAENREMDGLSDEK